MSVEAGHGETEEPTTYGINSLLMKLSEERGGARSQSLKAGERRRGEKKRNGVLNHYPVEKWPTYPNKGRKEESEGLKRKETHKTESVKKAGERCLAAEEVFCTKVQKREGQDLGRKDKQ